MSFNSRRKVSQQSASGNFNTIAAGNYVGLAAVPNMDQVAPGSLCADLSMTADTNTITLSAVWQVSYDNSTWLAVAPSPQGPSPSAVWGTGTAGADSAVRRIIEAPACVYAFPYVRIAGLVGVTTGAAADLYSVTLAWLMPAFSG